MLCTPDLARINCHAHPAATDRSPPPASRLCVVHDFESSRVEANLGPRPDTWTDARKELQTCQCILIPLIKVFPNLRIRGLKKDWGRENGEGLMELEKFRVNVLHEV